MTISLKYVLLHLSVSDCLQRVSGNIAKIDVSQNKQEKYDLSKGTYTYDVHTKSVWRVLEVCRMIVDSTVFKQ